MNRLGARYSAEVCGDGNFVKELGNVARGGTIEFDASSDVFNGYDYILTNAPDGVAIDSVTGMLSGRVSADAETGEYTMIVSLRDDGGFIGQSAKLMINVT